MAIPVCDSIQSRYAVTLVVPSGNSAVQPAELTNELMPMAVACPLASYLRVKKPLK